MIEKINLNCIATYTEPVELDDLREINFFYGGNGSGKTAISNLIANPEDYPSCHLTWQGSRKLKTVVYNEDFVTTTFYEKENLPGIFTLGEGAKDIEEEISKKTKELADLHVNVQQLENTISIKKKEKEENWNNFKDICWNDILQKYRNNFNNIFQSCFNSKQKLAKKILEEAQSVKTAIKDIEELKRKYSLLFSEDIGVIESINTIPQELIDGIAEIENNQILKAKIIGKEDIDIAKLIHKLQNHDWVRQGKKYYDASYDDKVDVYICPFCQQKTSDQFRRQLEEYFDETYENQIQEINDLTECYTAYKNKIESLLSSLKDITANEYLGALRNEISNMYKMLDQDISRNMSFLQNKKDKPSNEIVLEPVSNILIEINEIIEKINIIINNHNSIVENKEQEKNTFLLDIWKYFCNEISDQIQEYQKKINNIDKAIKEISKNIEYKRAEINVLSDEISTLHKQIKSVKPTVDAINNLLNYVGFKGFKLKPTDDDKHYEIIRDHGESAKKNLSEGERNFIIFLYFYHLIEGVNDPSQDILESKVIVFDDPVSSLDADVLFIVASLIKRLLKSIRHKEHSSIKQVFILTHNVHFFREVSYISSRELQNKRNDTKYFIIRKSNNVSKIEGFECNPIKSTYQLLWDEIKNDNVDCVCIQNAMRRIIEFYFNMLACINEEELLGHFEDKNERLICQSLISWLHAGSHEIFDDLNYSFDINVYRYKEIFKKIFEVTGHIEHYNMMMSMK